MSSLDILSASQASAHTLTVDDLSKVYSTALKANARQTGSILGACPLTSSMKLRILKCQCSASVEGSKLPNVTSLCLQPQQLQGRALHRRTQHRDRTAAVRLSKMSDEQLGSAWRELREIVYAPYKVAPPASASIKDPEESWPFESEAMTALALLDLRNRLGKAREATTAATDKETNTFAPQTDVKLIVDLSPGGDEFPAEFWSHTGSIRSGETPYGELTVKGPADRVAKFFEEIPTYDPSKAWEGHGSVDRPLNIAVFLPEDDWMSDTDTTKNHTRLVKSVARTLKTKAAGRFALQIDVPEGSAASARSVSSLSECWKREAERLGLQHDTAAVSVTSKAT